MLALLGADRFLGRNGASRQLPVRPHEMTCSRPDFEAGSPGALIPRLTRPQAGSIDVRDRVLDVGASYRSAIFYTTEEQKRAN